MHFLSNENYQIDEYYQLEVLGIAGDYYQNYPTVVNGYVFHFHLGHSLMLWNDSDFKFSLEHHWSHFIPGTLEELTIKLETFKTSLLGLQHKLKEHIDQFGYIHMFIVKRDNDYGLTIASDSFRMTSLMKLI